MRFNLTFLVLIIVYSVFAQIPAKKYKWKHLGPHTTATSLIDSGKWTAVGQGWVEDILIEKNAWYAGSITGGLYKSKNEGRRWKKIDDDTVQFGTLCLLKIGETIYRGTGLTHYDTKMGSGIVKSSDGGKTWSATGLSFSRNDLKPIWDISYSELDSTMAACTPEGIYISHDLGDSWDLVYKGENTKFRTILFSKKNKGVIWAAGTQLLYSVDNGKSWINKKKHIVPSNSKSKLFDIDRIALCEDPNQPNRYLAFYGFRNKGYVYESLDGGASWNKLIVSSKIRRADVHHTEIEIAPGNSNIVLIGTYRAYLSVDNCKTFKTVTNPEMGSPQFAHDDIRGMYMLSANEFYIATDGGVFRSIDRAQSWQNVSGKGLTIMQIYGMTKLADDRLIMGCQDMSYFINDKKKWEHLGKYYGDGGDALQTSSGVKILLGGKLKNIQLDTNVRYQHMHPPVVSNPFIAKLIRFPGAKDSFFYIGKECWMYDGIKWHNKSKSLPKNNEMIMSFDINASNPNQLFLSYDQPTWNSQNLTQKLYKSTDAGKSWLDITKNLPILAWRHGVSMATSSENPNNVYLSLGKTDDTDVYKVYKSIDGGKTWKNYSEGLLPYETFLIKHIPNCSGVIVSTLGGLYYRNDKMNKWQALSGKIPPIASRDFIIDKARKRLIVSTYGNGLWYMKLPKKMLKY
ncbi:hypothetical protein N9595_04475 [Bacteroidia bacterium]|nr:hypothetical protein [Bacteroidia bacterium]